MHSYTTEGLRHHNRALVLKKLRQAGAATHGDLSVSSGLASGTVSVILNELLDEQIIDKVQETKSTGRGRPKVNFSIVGDTIHAGLVRITSNEIEFSTINFAGTLKDRFTLPRAQDGTSPSDLVRQVRQGLNRLAERADCQVTDFSAVTFSTKGILDQDKKTVLWSAAFGDQVIDFGRAFHDLGDRLRLIHETALISEYLYEGPDPLACLSLGSTIGLGLTRRLNPELTEHNALIFSHLCHDPAGPLCRCGMKGCIDAYASFYGILRRALDAPTNQTGSQYIPGSEISQLAQDARRGNHNFQIAFHEAGEAIGLGLSRIASVYGSLEVVVTGHGVEYFDLLEPIISKHLSANLMTSLGHEIKISARTDEATLAFDALCQNTLSYIEEALVAPRLLKVVVA